MWTKIKKRINSLLENLITDVEEPKPAVEVPPEAKKVIKVTVLSDEQKKITIDELESMLKEVLGGAKNTTARPSASHILNSEGAQWYYDPINKQMVRVHSGTELVLSDPNPDDDGRVLCYCDLGFIMVPFENISELGYN